MCVASDVDEELTQLDIAQLKARLVTEGILLLAVRDWIRKLGLASYEKIMIRDIAESLPMVGTFAWDLTGPSYLAPMVDRARREKPKPGFIACDVLLSTVDEYGIVPFIKKCTTLSRRQLEPTGLSWRRSLASVGKRFINIFDRDVQTAFYILRRERTAIANAVRGLVLMLATNPILF
jgi:hypothetical protein